MNEPRDPQNESKPGTGSPATESSAAEVLALQQQCADLQDKLQRTLADAQNMRRRAQKEAEDARRRIVEGFTQELLPVLDNFELALQAWSEQASGGDPSALVQGVRMVQTLLLSALERHGLQELNAVGTSFDPARHEAIAVEPKDGVSSGQVLRALMKGYLLGDRVLRHAKVVVTGTPPAADDARTA